MEPSAQMKILLVDDEPNVLASLATNLQRRYQVATAESGAEALRLLTADGDIAVIVSDMRMPNMDGAALLAQARQVAPMAVRILLTGQADLASAVAAINQGQIFRFLTKPMAPPNLLAAIESAVAQHRLMTAERVLLEQTLRGCLRTMSEILALANPELFGRAARIQLTVRKIGEALGVADGWQIDVAAMLSQLAQISLPAETAEKLSRAAELAEDERAMTDRLPELTDRLLAHIPRFESVRVMLAKAQEPYRQSACIEPELDAQMVAVGAKLIKAAVAFDALTHGGLSAADAVATLRSRPQRFDPAVVEVLGRLYAEGEDRRTIVEIPLLNLVPGMILASDLLSSSGMLLVPRGFEVTAVFVERIRNYKPGSLQETVRVER